jgi:hypothetical protein
MSRTKAALLTLLSAAFVAAGALILTRGDAADAALAWGCIAFFGACGIVGLLQFLPRQRAASTGALTLQPDRMLMIGMAIGALAMALGCFLLAPLAAADGERITAAIAYIGVAFFGLGALAIVWRAMRLQALARLDEHGVHTLGLGGWSLAWPDITGIHVEEIESQRFIVFATNTRPPPLLSPIGFALSMAGTRLAFEDVLARATELWTRHRRA